jgi:RHS repeat-associated protein
MKPGQRTVGHPVDVATGTLYSTYRDGRILGKVDLIWERRYSTALLGSPPGHLGRGWTVSYFATLSAQPGEYHFVTPEGDNEVFSDAERKVERGGVVRNLSTTQELFKENDRYVVLRWDIDSDEIQRFIFAKGPEGQPWALQSIDNAAGQALDMLRDDKGRLVGVRQRLEKRTLGIEYSSEKISRVFLLLPGHKTQPLVTYEYDDRGQLASAADPLGFVDLYEYDATGRMTRELVKDGGEFSFKYDDKGRCIKTWGMDGYDQKVLRYREGMRSTEVVNSLGQATIFQWLPTGQVVQQTDPLGGVQRTEYDAQGRIVALISPTGAVTRIEYDAQGNRAAVVTPGGARHQFQYNAVHFPLTLTDASGGVWKREYDARNRLIATVNPLGHRCTYEYDAAGSLATVTTPTGTRRRYTFSENGILRSATNWTGAAIQFAFDPFGRLVQRTDALGQTTRMEYDLRGNLVSVERPDGSRVKLTYDAGSNVASVTDAGGNTTLLRHGSCSRILEQVLPGGDKLQYHWGTEPGRLERIVNEKGENCSLEYDAAGRVIREVGFDGRVQEAAYDKAGNRIAITNGNGEKVIFVRNEAGRLIAMQLPDGTTTTFDRDPAGNLMAASNSDMDLAFERDALGRVTRETQGTAWVRSDYDAVGNIVRVLTSLGHEARYQVDANGALVQLDVAGRSLQFTRNALGQELNRVVPGRLEFQQQFDTCGRVTEQRVLHGHGAATGRPDGSLGNAHLQRSYQYDRGGLLSSIQDSRWGTLQYRFDARERLQEARWSSGLEERFRYDPTSNITAVNLKMGQTSERTGHGPEPGMAGVSGEEILQYGPGNRLLKKGNTDFVHDGQGRLVRKTEKMADGKVREWQYAWNALDQLRSVTCPDGSKWAYRYDPLGRRIAKEGPDQTIRYVWDGDVVVHEQGRDGSRSTWIFDTQSYVPQCAIVNEVMYTVLADPVGTPQALFDARGELAWSGQYRAWGGLSRSPRGHVACGLRFQGQWFDAETGLHYSLYRYYDPETGRFLSPDPVGLNGGANFYSYVPNPTRWIDPLGLQLELGQGWTGRVDRFNTSFGTDHEMHVFNPSGTEVGIHGSEGWFAKHGHPAAEPPNMPPGVANTIRDIAQDEARRDGLLPEKGRADLKKNDWKDLVSAAKEKKEEEAEKAKACKSGP